MEPMLDVLQAQEQKLNRLEHTIKTISYSLEHLVQPMRDTNMNYEGMGICLRLPEKISYKHYNKKP
jgi:peptide deformylase